MCSIAPPAAGSYCPAENTWSTMMLWPGSGTECWVWRNASGLPPATCCEAAKVAVPEVSRISVDPQSAFAKLPSESATGSADADTGIVPRTSSDATRDRICAHLTTERSERSIALDRHAVHAPRPRPVVRDRIVLCAAVVPEGDRAGAPAEAALELGQTRVLVQEREQRVALAPRHAVDALGEDRIHEQRLAATHRMRAHDRMAHRRELAARARPAFGAVGVREQPGAEHAQHVVHRAQLREHALQRGRERVV